MDAVLVLNADFTPINTTTLLRGFVLVTKGKAEILKGGEKPILTSVGEFVRPLIIRLLSYVNFRPVKSRVSRHKIYKRDNHECVYCGTKQDLSIDHVIPRSRGGDNSWGNLVSCCKKCNSKKGNRTPEEANMKFIKKVEVPKTFCGVFTVEAERIYNDYMTSLFY
jgi:CRISPR/Cas system Type II protein with McrA/HNH and RuvC-like nuclease domain